jgi:hypothetical protein
MEGHIQGWRLRRSLPLRVNREVNNTQEVGLLARKEDYLDQNTSRTPLPLFQVTAVLARTPLPLPQVAAVFTLAAD